MLIKTLKHELFLISALVIFLTMQTTKPPFPLNPKHTLICLLMLVPVMASAESTPNNTSASAAKKTVPTATKPSVKKADTTDNEQPLTLDTMDVTSTSVGRGSKVEAMDISTTVLTREQIRRAPELTLDQMLSQQMGVIIPNVPANQSDPTGGTSVVQMRGLAGGEKVLVMVDGVPINDGFFRTIDWQQIPKDTVEKVEIIRGGGGAGMWGNLAMGGVINVITRAPEKGEKRIGFAYGNYNTKVSDAAITLFANDKIRTGLNWNSIDSDGYNQTPTVNQNANLVPSASRTRNGLWSTYLTPNNHSKYFLKIAGSELLEDHIVYGTQNNQWYKLDLRTGGKNNYSNTGSFNFSGFYEYSQMNKANGGLFPSTAKALNYVTGANVASALPGVTQREDMHYSTYGTSAYIEDRLGLGNWGSIDDIKIGADARGITTMDTNNIYAQIDKTANTAQFANANSHGQSVFEGFFAQGTFKPKASRFETTLGLREDLWQTVNSELGSNTYVNAANSTPNTSSSAVQPNTSFHQFNPRLSAKYGFENGIDLRSAVYRNFAAPGMNNLYRSYFSSSTAFMSNANLTPETSVSEEVGIDFTGKKVKTTFTAYHTQMNNYINSASVCGTSSYTGTACSAGDMTALGLPSSASSTFKSANKNMNIGQVEIFGAELFGQWDMLDTVQVNSSIIYTNSTLTSYTQSFGAMVDAGVAKGQQPIFYKDRQLPNVPIVMFTQGGKWDILNNLQFGWTIKAWPTYPNSTLNLGAVPRNNSAATTADLHIGYKPIKKLEIYMNAQNVANADYVATATSSSSSPSTLGMPRMLLGGFKLDF